MCKSVFIISGNRISGCPALRPSHPLAGTHALSDDKNRSTIASKIEALNRFPIKGLSAQGFPGDHKFGFARPNSGFDPADQKPLPKTRFYMLTRDASLALLGTVHDEDTGTLSLSATDGWRALRDHPDQGTPVKIIPITIFLKTARSKRHVLVNTNYPLLNLKSTAGDACD